MQPVRHPARRQPPARPGFTLIELLVVMVVIAILIGLLIPVVSSAMSRARETQVVAEMSSFDASLVNFKSKFGVDVPSFIVLCEEGDEWLSDWSSTPPAIPVANITDAHRRTSVALIRQVWSDFDFSVDRNFNDNGVAGEIIVLDGSECLVFFLGGVVTRGPTPYSSTTPIDQTMADDALVGFAANPTDPFNATSGNNRVGPYFENFSANRFTDYDEDGMPEYRDPLPGQLRPYIYLSSYGGNGYKPFGLDNSLATVQDNEIPHDAALNSVMYEGYFKTFGPPKTYLNPQSYQLISPGADATYGFGGLYVGANVPATQDSNGNNIVDPGEDSDGNGSVADSRTNERDNITNFQKGRLN